MPEKSPRYGLMKKKAEYEGWKKNQSNGLN